jgi:hypothetical protein
LLAAVFIFGFRKINVTKNNPLFFRIKNNKSDAGIFPMQHYKDSCYKGILK